jgi:phosphoribosyl-AMP cyclohydrolase
MDPGVVIDFGKRGGVVTAIAQDAVTGEILMVAYMNEESFRETVKTGRAVYWSTSRGRLWRKGEESGHEQIVKELRVDCDGDAVLLKVEQRGGAACHTGRRSCFFHRLEGGPGEPRFVEDGVQVFDPGAVYGRRP